MVLVVAASSCRERFCRIPKRRGIVEGKNRTIAIGRSVEQLLAQPLGFNSDTVISAEIMLPDVLTLAPDFSGEITAAT